MLKLIFFGVLRVCAVIAAFLMLSAVMYAAEFSAVDIYARVAPSLGTVVTRPEGSGDTEDSTRGTLSSSFHVGGGHFISTAHSFPKGHTYALSYGGTLHQIQSISLNIPDDVAAFSVPELKGAPALEFCALAAPPGTTLYALGWPLGIGPAPSITAGVISSYNDDHILFDTPIAPGNSGGPLVTAAGCVAGVVQYTQVYDKKPMFVFNGGATIERAKHILAFLLWAEAAQ